jgi:hypothetical protein
MKIRCKSPRSISLVGLVMPGQRVSDEILGTLEIRRLMDHGYARLSAAEPNSNILSASHELALMALLRILLYR